MTAMPVLEPPSCLIIRPFALDDLQAISRILDCRAWRCWQGGSGALALEAVPPGSTGRVLNGEQLASLHQPPYGDRAGRSKRPVN